MFCLNDIWFIAQFSKKNSLHLIYSLYKMTHTVNFIVFHGRIQAIQVAGTELK